MSEIRTNLTVSGESSEYRGNIGISVVTLNSNLVDTQSSFRTNIEVSLNIENDTISSIKTDLELNNVSLDFYLVDMTKLNQSILYFSKFFNMNFEPEIVWNLLSQGTNEQINSSHLSEALSDYIKYGDIDSIYKNIESLEGTINGHIRDNVRHLTETEKKFLHEIMYTPPWNTGGGEGGGEVSESLFKLVNIGSNAKPQYAVVPKEFNGNTVHIMSYGDIIAGGQGEIEESGGGATTLGGLNNVDNSVDQIFSTDKVLIKSSLDSHWKAFDLSSIVGLDVDALKAYLNTNEYATITDINNSVTPIAIKVDGYNDRILALESLGLTIKEENGKKYLQSEYDFIGLGDIVAGGGEIGEDDGKNGTLGSLYNVDNSVDEVYSTDKVLIKSANKAHWSAFDVSSIVGLDTNALKQYLDTNKYITETALEGYATTDDVTELSNSVSNLRTDFDNLNNLLNDDTSGVIDTWNEVVDFLNGYKESEDLATILSKMNEDIANRVLSTDFNSYKTTTDSRISALESLGLSIVVENGKTYLKSEHSVFTEKDIIAGGMGEEGAFGGIIQQVYGVSAFGQTFDANNLTDTFNAHAINSLYTTIQRGVKNPYALTINGTSYDGSSAVDITISGGTAGSIAWDAITGKPSLVYYDTHIDTNTLANSVAKMGYGYATEGWYESGPALSFGVENYQFQMQMRLSAEISSVVWRPVQSGTKFTWRHFLDAYNYSNYALPLSGGTMTGSVTFPTNTYNYIGELALIVMPSAPTTLQLRTTNSSAMSAISFHASTKWYGTLSADTDSNLRWNDNIVIHSGNIGSQSVSYATVSNGVDNSGAANLTYNRLQFWYDWGENSITGYGGAYKYGLHIGSPDPNYYFQVGISTAYNGLYGRFKSDGTWNSWREIAFTDSNVASATKATQDGNGNTIASTYLKLSGGTVSNSSVASPIIIDSSAPSEVGLQMTYGGVTKAWFGWWNNHNNKDYGTYMYSAPAGKYMGITNTGVPHFQLQTILHEGNYSSYALPLSGGTLEADNRNLLRLKDTNTGSNRGAYIRFDAGTTTGYSIVGYNNSFGAFLETSSGAGYFSLRVTHDGYLDYNSNAKITYTPGSSKGYTGLEIINAPRGGEASIGFTSNASKRAVVGVWESALNLWTQSKLTCLSIPITTGNVLIGTTTDKEGKLQVNGSIISNTTKANYTVHNSVYYTGVHSYMSDMANGDNIDIAVGKAYTTKQMAYFGYHRGSSDATSYLTLGLYAVDNILNICTSGNTLINTTTDDGYKLNINGSVQVKAGDYIPNRATLILNSNSGNAADIIFKANSATKGNYGWWAISSRNDGTGSFMIFRGGENGANAYELPVLTIGADAVVSVASNFVASGDVTSGSDARYKRIESYAEIDIETIANAPIINFKWIDREDDKLHLGSTAQYWYNTSLLNGVIPTDDEKLWTMGYGQIALASVVSVAKKVVNHEERIAALEKENMQLKQQLNEYRRLS